MRKIAKYIAFIAIFSLILHLNYIILNLSQTCRSAQNQSQTAYLASSTFSAFGHKLKDILGVNNSWELQTPTLIMGIRG